MSLLVMPHTLLPASSPALLPLKSRTRHRTRHPTHLHSLLLLLHSLPNTHPPEHLHRCLHVALRALQWTVKKPHARLECNLRRLGSSRTSLFLAFWCLRICSYLAERWLRLFCDPWAAELVMAVVLFPRAGGLGFASWKRGLGDTWLRRLCRVKCASGCARCLRGYGFVS